MTRIATLTKLGDLAEQQWGLITRRQVENAGVSPATITRLAGGNSPVLERVTRGVYRLAGAPQTDHLALRAAWLQLAPDTPAWDRNPAQGVVSHRSAAALYELGHLPADRHEFTLPGRRQSRHSNVRLHRRPLTETESSLQKGLPVTRPARIAADLLAAPEDPEAVAQVIADALRNKSESAAAFVGALAPHAARLGLRRRDGLAALRWLLELAADPATAQWMKEA